MKLRRVLAAVAATVTFGIAGVGTAVADNLAVDGDLLATTTALSFGNVTCNQRESSSVAAVIRRLGGSSSQQVFANSAVVTITGSAAGVPAGTSISAPGASLTLPSNWVPAMVDSPILTLPVHITSSVPGPGAATITYVARGLGSAGGAVTRPATINVTWNTRICNTAPVVTVTGVTHGATYTFGAVPAAGCSVTDAEDVGESASPVVNGPASGVGTFTATCSYTDAGGLTASTSATYTIAKAASSVSVTCPTSVEYDGTAQTPCTATVTGAGGLSAGVAVVHTDNTNAGTATATADFAGDGQHLPSTGSATFAITQAASLVTVTCPSSVVYDGSAQTPCTATATGVGGLSVDVAVDYSGNTNAGTASASASYAGDANHSGDTGTGGFTISQAPSVVSIICAVGPIVYDGSAKAPCSATVTGAGGLNESLTVTYLDNTNAGTASASAAFAGDANHEASSDDTTFEIAKAPSVVLVTCGAGPFTYDGGTHEPCTAGVTGAGGLDQSVSVGYANNVNAGTATASASYGGDANHLAADDTETFVIAKADTTTAVSCTAEVTWTGSAQEVCTASVSGPGGLADSVDVTYADNTEVGTASASATYGGGPNHNGSTDSATFEIIKAPSVVTVVCDPTSVVYTGAAQTPCSAEATGVLLNEAVSVTYADNVNAGTATASSIWPGDAHHTGNEGSVTFQITKAPSTVTVTCPDALTATGSPLTPCTAVVTGAGGLNQALTVSYANNTTFGTATATATFAGGANHEQSSGSATFTIRPWTLNGFYQPVDMFGVYNVVRGGSTVPLKFEVFRDGVELTSTSAVKSFTEQAISCSGTALSDEVETTTTGGTVLRYDSTGGQFIQNWQTPKLPGACYRVTMTTMDGSTLVAYFRLR